MPYQRDIKSKIENRGNTKEKQEKHSRKPWKHQRKQAETPGDTAGNRTPRKYNIKGITMIIRGILSFRNEMAKRVSAKCIYDIYQLSISHKL